MLKKIITVMILVFISAPVWAADTGGVSGGDTGFMLVCAAMVMLMTPAAALFYGGMVRTKNVFNTIMQCVFVMGLITVQW